MESLSLIVYGSENHSSSMTALLTPWCSSRVRSSWWRGVTTGSWSSGGSRPGKRTRGRQRSRRSTRSGSTATTSTPRSSGTTTSTPAPETSMSSSRSFQIPIQFLLTLSLTLLPQPKFLSSDRRRRHRPHLNTWRLRNSQHHK